METNIVARAMALIRQHKFAEARELLLPAADKGETEPQALLGQVYNAGWGVPVDYGQAFKWWSRAAEAGSTDAQWGLGLLYDEGKGVPRDSKKAANWWKRGAEHGNIKATVNLDWKTPTEGPLISLSYDGDAEVKQLGTEASLA